MLLYLLQNYLKIFFEHDLFKEIFNKMLNIFFLKHFFKIFILFFLWNQTDICKFNALKLHDMKKIFFLLALIIVFIGSYAQKINESEVNDRCRWFY